ncbi:hypothetical protein K466DRAFT_663695 [Polyporus arcularius HHB13444]|uniref:Ras modification protein ERF4 n=1 Tax=Polyporus arcularius HHB13444 TaxID=1314778 RepID=A0A5C3PA60_9APHY|nr:hypothetical protein K466DRAFT_663695 [Polyporus arcularius HHB13444]
MSRPSSPSGSKDTPGLAPHEAATGATLAASASPSPSPVPPTPPPKDALFPNTTREAHPSHLQSQSQSQPQSQFQSQSQSASTPTAAAMSKVGPKAAPPEEMDDPTELMVIDISGPPYDPDETIRVDSDADADGGHVHGEESPARESDVTDADITIVHPDVGRRSDSPEHGGSTLYGSGSGLGLGSGSGAGMDGEREREHEREREREHVQEHPLRLDVYPPSPPQWERDLESGDVDGEADLDLGRGGGGRASPQRFVFSSAKAQRVHEYGNGHGNGHGNGNGSRAKLSGRPRIPHSAYYFGPPPPDSAYGTEPCGQIGVHHPREVVRIERDYTGGELPQFMPTYPLELEGRITPTQFLETVNAINEILLSAHSLRHAFVDNALAYFSLQISRALVKTHYEKEMERLHALIDELNVQMYNPVGLHIRWPRSVAFLFLEIEYYVRVMGIPSGTV